MFETRTEYVAKQFVSITENCWFDPQEIESVTEQNPSRTVVRFKSGDSFVVALGARAVLDSIQDAMKQTAQE